MDLKDIKMHGACRDEPLEIFFPPYDSPSANAAAKAICDHCAVKPECLDWAMTHDEVGIWGGTGETDRRALDRKRHRRACAVCGATEIVNVEDTEVCLTCGASWFI